MTEKNKNVFAFFAKVAALFVWLILVIITCAGNWNYNPEGFVKWCTFFVMAINFAAIAYLFIKWRKEYLAEVEAIQQKERQELIDSAKK